MDNTINLNNLPLGSCAKIKCLTSKGIVRRRMLDLGFVPNSDIEALYISPSGEPKAYLIKNTVIALRNEDASNIRVEEY